MTPKSDGFLPGKPGGLTRAVSLRAWMYGSVLFSGLATQTKNLAGAEKRELKSASSAPAAFGVDGYREKNQGSTVDSRMYIHTYIHTYTQSDRRVRVCRRGNTDLQTGRVPSQTL